jgi:hypothetical protein
VAGFVFRQNEKLVRYKFTVMADNIYEYCRIAYFSVYSYLYISSGTDFNRIEDLHFLMFFIPISLIPYSYVVEVFHFSLDLYTIDKTPWTGDQPVAKPLPKCRTTQTQNKRTHITNIRALSEIRTHDHGVRASEDSSCLRPLGYRGRQIYIFCDISK